MQSLEEKQTQDKVIIKTSIITNFVYLFTHVFYLIFFLITKTYVLAYINIVSIAIYLSFFLLIKYGKYKAFANGCGGEIMTYMTVATILCGFEPGFHLCIIGLCVIAFYSVYFSKKRRENKRAVIWTIFSMFMYLILHFVCSFNETPYPLPKWANVTLFALHGFVVFAFICAYLRTFTSYAIVLENRIMKESRLDQLTQINNRHALYHFYEGLKDKKDYYLAIFDIDDFKKVNDKYGHICGDYILKRISKVVSDNIGDDFFCRYGGEEFIILSHQVGDKKTIKKHFDQIRKKIEEHEFIFDGTNIPITVTMGVAEYKNYQSADRWIDIADEKLYIGKSSGKDIVIM